MTIATTTTSVFRNLDCLSLVDCGNTTLLKIQTVLFLFFPNSALRNRGCGLSMNAAYTRMFTVQEQGRIRELEYEAEKLQLEAQLDIPTKGKGDPEDIENRL